MIGVFIIHQKGSKQCGKLFSAREHQIILARRERSCDKTQQGGAEMHTSTVGLMDGATWQQ
jgi:hypothetical protein